MGTPITHPAAADEQELLTSCDVARTRRSGPGGQNRNKVETAVVLTHRPTGLRAEAAERRSQHENLRAALRRLRFKLAVETRSASTDPDAPPSPLWRSRCRGGRISVSDEHADLPALLAEALDRIALRAFDLPAAAASLGCTTTQLVNLLRKHPPALRLVNERRAALGAPPLR